MKVSIFIYFLFFLPISALCQAKPTKEFTINYLIEKLNQDCTGEFLLKTRQLYSPDKDLMSTVQSSMNCRKFNIIIKDNIPYLTINIQSSNKGESFYRNETWDKKNDVTVEIPISKVINITFVDKKSDKTTGLVVDQTFNEHLLGLQTASNNILITSTEDGGTSQYTSAFVFRSGNLEDEGKIKKAFENLISYYPKTKDPFDN